MKVKVIVTGIRDIDRRLKTLPLRVQKKVTRKAMRDGLKIIAAEMRVQVPSTSGRGTGRTRAAIKVRAKKRKKRDVIEMETLISGKIPGLIVRPKGGGKPTFYPAVIEYGRSDMPPNPFGRRTYDAKGASARDTTIQSLRAGVEAEARKP